VRRPSDICSRATGSDVRSKVPAPRSCAARLARRVISANGRGGLLRYARVGQRLDHRGRRAQRLIGDLTYAVRRFASSVTLSYDKSRACALASREARGSRVLSSPPSRSLRALRSFGRLGSTHSRKMTESEVRRSARSLGFVHAARRPGNRRPMGLSVASTIGLARSRYRAAISTKGGLHRPDATDGASLDRAVIPLATSIARANAKVGSASYGSSVSTCWNKPEA